MSRQTTVRDETFALMRSLGMTRVFGNPGSTEIPFLSDFPDDLEFVLGLHEGGVVGMASGYALGSGRPAFVNLHTAAGLGNAVNAIVCARDNGIPLVIVVGQQDRRQLGLMPFLASRSLERLAGDYPVWTTQPAAAAELPGAIARAWHEAVLHRGPALVIAPMGDWDEELGDDWPGVPAPELLLHEPIVDGGAVAQLAELLEAGRSPALVVGAGVDTPEGWEATVGLAERLSCPVWQDTFSSRAGFPQDHELFAGHLPWRRSELRSLFAAHDLVLALGTPAFRLYLYDSGPLVGPETRVAVVSESHEEILRSPCDLALNASPAAVCAELAQRLPQRNGAVLRFERPTPPAPPADGGPLQAAHLVQALAERLPADAILVEEAPSTRAEILARIAVRRPLGFVAVANGALGFGLAGAVGLRMALPDRPVVALLGDGSSMYSVQALWTAAHYGVGALFVVVGNGAYAIMDELADARGAPGPWPAFDTLSPALVAEGLGCPSRRIETHDELTSALDEAIPTLHERREPLLLDVRIA
ncbi:MAG TPA: thiamine pyrophosphate-binding protein [Gaiellaceae bacterium]